MRTILLLLSSALSATGAFAQNAHVDRIEIVEYGLYDLKTIKKVDSPSIASGLLVVTEGSLMKQTTTIPAKLGVAFGYTVKIHGSPEGGTVTVRDINIVPEPGLHNPKTGHVVYREEATYTRKIGETFRSDYQLSYDWTLVPGKWVFQLWIDNRKMAEQIFTLVKD
ncbi:MAG TPA: DUF3859 domain-containing protein [Xanthobacteraceae bacterium]|nr:DUF3859 domain-containing protein [Xanthobacteraceae bacterium]